MRVLFVLPGEGGGGGAHSVAQESVGLARLGVQVAIATTADTLETFRWHYAHLDDVGVAVRPFTATAELTAMLGEYDLAVATTAPSAHLLAQARGPKPKGLARAAYYVQDYEPLFRTPGTERWTEARESYAVLGDALLFAKTDWLCRIVYDNHGRPVQRVKPSVDHGVYHPARRAPEARLTVAAMVRPKTLRRGPRRTVRTLERIAATYGDRVKVVAFGCDAKDYDRIGVTLSPSVEDRGVLRRHEVAGMLRECDLFLDLSDYQAFGRTGLEAMASGCTPVLPVFGGAYEYARHWDNALLVDPRSDEAIMEAVDGYFGAAPAVRARLRDRGVATALDYTVEKAAWSEYQVFRNYLGLDA
jgi:glycosyltransferase involved in cell wall biosynthesis